jgi:tRNA-specific 2-thiouridylase
METVFVGMSGGVDSSVAAQRLKNQGYNVVGVFIKVWHPDWLECNWEQERLDAMRVAAHLDIPFLTCDAEAAYRDGVAEYFIAEYEAGRTPNPDVMCNQQVKFGAFLDFAKRRGADYIATGHYAQRVITSTGPELHRGVDSEKDQTYFLWTLTDAQLAASLFPVGDTAKEMIRAEAEAANLPVATKKDSQGICFLGHINIPEFLGHYVTIVPGAVLNHDGEVIGEHQGALVYTIGQRHGFTLDTHDAQRVSHYVVAKDVEHNTITVSPTRPQRHTTDGISLSHIVTRDSISPGDILAAQFRYRQTPVAVRVQTAKSDNLRVVLKEPVDTPAAGQSCVLYRGTHCVGGGIIEGCQSL